MQNLFICVFYLLIILQAMLFYYIFTTSFKSYSLLSDTISSIGLLMDLIGVIIIAHFVNETFRGFSRIRGAKSGNPRKIAPSHINKEFSSKKDQTLFYYGYWYIGLGFIFQFIAIWIK